MLKKLYVKLAGDRLKEDADNIIDAIYIVYQAFIPGTILKMMKEKSIIVASDIKSLSSHIADKDITISLIEGKFRESSQIFEHQDL